VIEMGETLINSMAIGSGTGIAIAFLEGRTVEEAEQFGFWGTTLGFLAGLFLTICCPESSQR
jgi:hypothetical protein